MQQISRSFLMVAGLVWCFSHVADAQQRPEGVTDQALNQGKQLFGSTGLCFACHGQNAKGIPNLGVDLTDAEWLHSDGGFEGILGTIRDGVTSEESSSGIAMPPKGGSQLNEDQLKAVAAYVWSLSHG